MIIDKEALEHLKEKGYYVQQNYYSESECKKIIKIIDDIIIKNNIKNVPKKEGLNGDTRVYLFEKYYKKFLEEQDICDVLSNYAKRNLDKATCIGGRLQFSENENRNSGGDWHRDSIIFQVKAILYLSDVTDKNGPFQFISKSTRKELKDNCKTTRIGKDYPELIKELTNINICGKAGTLLLVNTSNIHRGKPILSGTRYSLTNYYTTNKSHTKSIINRFSKK